MNYSDYARKIKSLQAMKDFSANKEAKRLAHIMNQYIDQKFVLRFNLRTLDCDLLQQACRWTLRCPKCGCEETKYLYGHGQLPLKHQDIYCESYHCQICGCVFSSKPFGWTSKNDLSEPVLMFPVKNSNGSAEQWSLFIMSYLHEWKHLRSVCKQGLISNISSTTGMCRKTVRQWSTTLTNSIFWICDITNSGFTVENFLHILQKEDIPFLIWILYLYSYEHYPVR